MFASQRMPEVQQLQRIRDLVQDLPAQEYYQRLTNFQTALAADMLRTLYALAPCRIPSRRR